MDSTNIETVENYIHKKRVSLDLIKLKKSCIKLNLLIINNFSNNKIGFIGKSTFTTHLYDSYNLLLYPFEQFHELFHEIKQFFYELIKNDEECMKRKYYIQCWLNYYKKGEFIDWHMHWESKCNAWHGFYCLDTESSYTSYKLPHLNRVIDIVSENNMIVLGKSDNDIHKSSEWMHDRPRITIAFDIVPVESLENNNKLNHWIPL